MILLSVYADTGFTRAPHGGFLNGRLEPVVWFLVCSVCTLTRIRTRIPYEAAKNEKQTKTQVLCLVVTVGA